MKKAVKAGIIGAGALGYSIIPTYLMKYHWIIRDKKMAKKEEKVLYLTFDDGPDTVYTNKLLDLLDQEQVPATFFMVAEAAQGHPDQTCLSVHSSSRGDDGYAPSPCCYCSYNISHAILSRTILLSL